jgi:phage replication initiation protein
MSTPLQFSSQLEHVRGSHRAKRGADREPCPPALTGGESFTQSVKIDWLTTTWLPDADEHIPATVHNLLLGWMPFKVKGVDAPGMFGYEKAIKFYISLDDGADHHVARVDFGGMHHKMRARLDLSGSACACITQWQNVQDWISAQFDHKITRVDLAADFLNGEFTVEDAKDWYLAGEFNAGGRMPRHSTPGDWLNPHYGRTLEVGRRENGKMLRCYEKGRQLGNSDSPWTRFEVEIRNIDRDIPLEVLTECDEYFVGAYKCLEKILSAAGQKIATHQAEGEISLERLTECARTSYGQLLNVLRATMSAGEVLDHISRSGVPKRLEKASLSGFLTKAPPAKGNHHEDASSRY